MGPKRRRDDGGGSGGGGSGKKRWHAPASSRGPVIPIGSKGFLVSCVTGKEMLASREAIDLLGQYIESPKAEQPAAAAGSDISALIAEEVADVKSGTNQQLTWHKTNITGLLYLALDDSAGEHDVASVAAAPTLSAAVGVGPVELVQRMATDVQATKQCKSRLCLRFIPVEHVCSSNLDAMKKLAADVLPVALPPRDEDAESETFAVQYEHRASTDLKRMDVINTFVDHVPKGYKVDLDKATHTILVQLVKSCCTLAIVPRYRELLKFNVRELSGCGDGAAASAAAKAGKQTDRKPGDQTGKEAEAAQAKAEGAVPVEAGAPDAAAAAADGVTPGWDATSVAVSTPATERGSAAEGELAAVAQAKSASDAASLPAAAATVETTDNT